MKKTLLLIFMLIVLSSFTLGANSTGYDGYQWYDDTTLTGWSGGTVNWTIDGDWLKNTVSGYGSNIWIDYGTPPNTALTFCINSTGDGTVYMQGYIRSAVDSTFTGGMSWIYDEYNPTSNDFGVRRPDNTWNEVVIGVSAGEHEMCMVFNNTVSQGYYDGVLSATKSSASVDLSTYDYMGVYAGINTGYKFKTARIWYGGYSDKPSPTPSTILTTTLDYPINETHYSLVNSNSSKVYTGFVNLTTNLNANCTINNINWTVNITNGTTHSFYNSNTTEGNYSMQVNCSNVVNTTITDFWFIIDQTDVIANINILNNSIQANEFNLTVDYFDLYLYRTNTTIIRMSDNLTIYNNFSGDLGYETEWYNVTYPINLLNSTYIVGDTIKVIVNGVDTHTAKKFDEKPKSINVKIADKNIKSYNLKKGEFRLEYPKDMEIEEDYSFDRMQFKLKSEKLKNKYTYQYVEADKIVYYENSEYPCHMIVNDNYWYDCVGMKYPKVTKERNNRYKIDFYMDSEEVITKSLGGLNEIYEEYFFTINKNYTGNIEVGDFFNPPNALFNYTTLYNFTVTNLLLDENCITINGSNVSSYNGQYCYNLTALELEDVVLFAGATPVDCYIDLATSAGDINTISYEWYNKTNNILESGFNLCDSDAYCTLDELSGSTTNENNSVTCRAIINDSWFNFSQDSNTINTSIIDFCAGDIMYPIVNITYKDELDNSLITALSSYNLTFFEGTSTFSFKNNNTGNHTQFCTDTNETFNLNMYGNLILSFPTYITRVFNIPSTEGILVSNNPYTNFSLYLIGVANSSTVSYTWRTTDYNNIDGTMQIYRCEADGSRTLIESTTVSSGQASANLQLYTTAYSYSITIDDTTYIEPQYYDCHVESTQTKTYTVNILDIDVLPVIGLYLMDCHIENITATTVRMTWDGNDEDATDIEACIIGYREDIYGRNKVYESCVNQSSGTLTRNIGLTGFSYYVQGSLTQNGITGMCQETVVFNQRGDTSRTIGITGVFLAALLIIALGLLAAGDGTMTILFSIIAILIIWIIGIVSFNWVIVSSIIILGIIIALIGRHTLKGV